MTDVIMNKSGERETYNDCYAARLFEQGKAVLAPKTRAVKSSRKKTEAVTADEPEEQDRS